MANTSITTINQLISYFKQFADGHPSLNDFGYGPTSEIGASRQMQFPYLWVTHRAASRITLQNKTQLPAYNFTFLIVDRINQQENYQNINGLDSDNQQETVSDCKQLADDFLVFVQTSLNEVGVSIDNQEISLEIVFDETPDKVTGVMFDLMVKTKHINCTTPLSGATIPLPDYPTSTGAQYLQCSTLTACTSLGIFVDNKIEEAAIIDPWTIELIDLQEVDFYAPYEMQINSITNILNAPSIDLYDDDVIYSLGATIGTGSKITVSANTASVITLNAVKL